MQPELVFCWSQGRLTLGPTYAAQDAGYRTAFTMNDFHWNQFVAHHPAQQGLGARLRNIERHLFTRLFLNDVRLEHVTCISERLRSDLLREGVPVGHAEILYQGIPIEQFPMRENAAAAHDPVRFLFVGQLHEYKGPHTAISALAELSVQNTPPMSLTLVGGGPSAYRDRLQKMANDLGVSDRVTFTGKLPLADLPALYREHDIFLFTSIWPEPFGLTFLEAMASGIPVLSTTVGGQAECLEDGVNCLTFTADNPSSLAEGMLKLLDNADLRRSLTLEARRRVEANFTMQAYIDRIEQFLLASLHDS